MNSNFDNVLSALNRTIQKNHSVQVWLPSLINTETQHVLFMPLSIQQQNNLLKTTLNRGDFHSSAYTKALYQIIQENYINNNQTTITTNDFTVLDKIFISLKLRSSIGNTYTIVKDDISTVIDLALVYNTLKEAVLNNINLISTQSFKINDIQVTCNLPTIAVEAQCEQERPQIPIEEIESQIQNIIFDTVGSEISKFSSVITIDGNEPINLNAFSFAERKKIVEQLPTTVLNNILEYTVNYKQLVEQALTYRFTTKEDKEAQDTLQFNGSFFAAQ